HGGPGNEGGAVQGRGHRAEVEVGGREDRRDGTRGGLAVGDAGHGEGRRGLVDGPRPRRGTLVAAGIGRGGPQEIGAVGGDHGAAREGSAVQGRGEGAGVEVG